MNVIYDPHFLDVAHKTLAVLDTKDVAEELSEIYDMLR
jgi:hypothetical protein